MSQSTHNRGRRGSFGGRSRFNSNNRPKYGRSRKGPAKQHIDPSRFIKSAKIAEVDEYVPKHTFNDFAVNDYLKSNIQKKGFTQPSPIQDQTIPLALEGKDVVGLANTGTGKTAAFLIPLAHMLAQDPKGRAIIVAPTRELAMQIRSEAIHFIKGSRVHATTLIGGSPMGPQIRDLQRKPQLVIGTPGRIKDHIDRRNLDPSTFTIAVLDEVDRMLDMGFVHEITALLAQLHPQKQSLFFSATMEPKIASLIETFANSPTTVSVKTGNTSDNVEQNIVRHAPGQSKIDLLHDILIQDEVSKVLVFDDTKRSVDRLSKSLTERGFASDSIHGNKSQGQRKRALERFRRSEVTILVATDVAARGIDVADVTHVINYSTPNTYEDYTHRIGRAGRAGRKGHALTFVSN